MLSSAVSGRAHRAGSNLWASPKQCRELPAVNNVFTRHRKPVSTSALHNGCIYAYGQFAITRIQRRDETQRRPLRQVVSQTRPGIVDDSDGRRTPCRTWTALRRRGLNAGLGLQDVMQAVYDGQTRS